MPTRKRRVFKLSDVKMVHSYKTDKKRRGGTHKRRTEKKRKTDKRRKTEYKNRW